MHLFSSSQNKNNSLIFSNLQFILAAGTSVWGTMFRYKSSLTLVMYFSQILERPLQNLCSLLSGMNAFESFGTQ